MRVFTSLDHVAQSAGESLGSSDWVMIEQKRIDLFADATDDHQWIHTDQNRSANGPYGGTIAHGFLTLSLIPSFMQQVISYEFDPVRVNYGLDRVRFLAPVRAGESLRDSITLASVNPSGGGLKVTFDHTIEIAGSDRPACVATSISLLTV